MVEYGRYVSEGTDSLEPLAPLLALPALWSFLNLSAIQIVLSHQGIYFGIAFPFPTPIGDLWTFVSLPSADSTQLVAAHGAGSIFPASAIAFVLIGGIGYAVGQGVVVAAYLGSISQYRSHGSYDVLANIRRYAIQYIVISLIVFGVVSLAALLVLLSPVFVLLAFPLILLFSYLFWGAWFLVCTTDSNVTESLRWSYHLATSRNMYFKWSAYHLLISAIFSILVSVIVVNGGMLGILVGIVVAVPVGFVLTVASMSVIEDIRLDSSATL